MAPRTRSIGKGHSELLPSFPPPKANLEQSDSRLYSFSPETKEKLRKFRLGTSRAKDAQAIICMDP